MNFKCICSTLFITLTLTLIISLILMLLGIDTIPLISPNIIGLILFEIGLINLIISFVALLYRSCGCKCYIKCFSNKLFLLFLFSLFLVIFSIIGFIIFFNTTINILIFSIGIFLVLGILLTEISILFPLLGRNNILG